MNFLLIDPGPATHAHLIHYMRAAGHHLTRLSDSSALAAALGLFACDAVLLGMDPASDDARSLDVLRRLREINARLPVIVLSSREAAEECVRMLGLGADDYLPTPCHPEELLARLNARVRAQTLN